MSSYRSYPARDAFCMCDFQLEVFEHAPCAYSHIMRDFLCVSGAPCFFSLASRLCGCNFRRDVEFGVELRHKLNTGPYQEAREGRAGDAGQRRREVAERERVADHFHQ